MSISGGFFQKNRLFHLTGSIRQRERLLVAGLNQWGRVEQLFVILAKSTPDHSFPLVNVSFASQEFRSSAFPVFQDRSQFLGGVDSRLVVLSLTCPYQWPCLNVFIQPSSLFRVPRENDCRNFTSLGYDGRLELTNLIRR